MSDLVEFLRARLDEQEASRWWFHKVDCVATVDEERLPPRRDCDCYYPARVLAEVAAKRAILEHAERGPADRVGVAGPALDYGRGLAAGFEFTLRYLARPYAEHPDFDPAW